MFDIYGVWEMTASGSLLAMQPSQYEQPPRGCYYFNGRVFQLNPADIKPGKKYRVVFNDGSGRPCYTQEIVLECSGVTEPTVALKAALHLAHRDSVVEVALPLAAEEPPQPAFPRE